MGFILDTLIKIDIEKEFLTVDQDYTSDKVDVSGAEDGYAITLLYDNGGSVDVEFSLEVAEDGQNFVTLSGSEQAITDNSGTIIWDVVETNVTFVRIHMAHTSGTLDIKASLSAKRRH